MLLALDRNEEALEVLAAVRDHYESLLQGGLLGRDEWEHFRELHGEASRLADSAQATLQGRESLVVGPATRGKLDGRAGVNYQLLGESLMVGAPRIATDLALASPQETERRATEILRVEPKSSHGLALKASAQLRLGDVSLARELFEKASALDGRNFAAFLGLGAALDHQCFDLLTVAGRLPVLESPKELAQVVPDLPALSPLEKRVVVASVAPLAGCLPQLVRAGARIQLLPIDVRATDLPELQGSTGERTDDHRAYDAIGGLANAKLAVARVDELLDVVSDHGLVFAHEFAHLAFFHLSERQRGEVEEIYDRAVKLGWVAEGYALENPDEFFAVSYTDWLRTRLELPLRREPDEAGVFEAIGRVFEELGPSAGQLAG